MWTLGDRIDALVWQEVDDDRCSGCGQPRSESFHPDNEDGYSAKAFVCFGCQARVVKQNQLENPDSHRFTYFVATLDGEEQL